jgi:hypothetical protein
MKTENKKQNSRVLKIFFISFLLFALSQLIINSILTPLGTHLERLNTQKEILLEENRLVSEQIAENNSIKVIEKLSKNSLDLDKNIQKKTIYIENSSLLAEKK